MSEAAETTYCLEMTCIEHLKYVHCVKESENSSYRHEELYNRLSPVMDYGYNKKEVAYS